MKRRAWWWIALAAVLLVGAGAYWQLRAPAVAVAEVQAQPLLRTLQFSARVASRSRVDVGATLTGRVQAVRVQEGEWVMAGQELLLLEDAELQAAVAQALAGEQQAAARLQGLRSTGRSSVLAATAQAESVWLAAKAEAERTRELVNSGFLSPARQDESQRALAVAQAQLDAARAQARALGDQGTELAQAQAQLALARAATQAARVRLTQARITAPTEARVLLRAVEPGQIVQPGRALLSLALQGPLQLVALVDERYLQQLQLGQSAQVRADAFPDQAFSAQVLSIAALVDAQRGAVEVKLQVSSEPAEALQALRQRLREDMTLSVEVVTGQRERALLVPLAALRSAAGRGPARSAENTAATPEANGRNDSAQAVVWLVKDGHVEARAVRTGLRNLQAAEVLDGLTAGEQVLVGEAPPPGSRVRAQPMAPPSGNLSGSAALGTGTGTGTGTGNSTGSSDAGPALSNAMGR